MPAAHIPADPEGNDPSVLAIGQHGSEGYVFLGGENGCEVGKNRGEERLGRAFCRGAEVAHPLLVDGDGQGEALRKSNNLSVIISKRGDNNA